MRKIDLRSIDLNLLPVFEVLMAERHVSRAATRLSRTQSAVSYALDRLREQLNDPLLVRIGGMMQPTPYALELITELAPLLNHIQRVLAPRELFEPAISERTFRIVLPEFWDRAVARFLGRLEHVAPGIALEWLAPHESSLRDLATSQVALVVAPSSLARPKAIQSVQLGKLHWKSLVRNGHPAIQVFDRTAWFAYPHIVVAGEEWRHSPVQTAHCGPMEKRRIGACVPHFNNIAPLLARTDMIATLPAMAIAPIASHFDLVALPPPIEFAPIVYDLCWCSHYTDEPALTWLRDTLMPDLQSLFELL